MRIWSLILITLLLVGIVEARELSVEKIVMEDNLKTGDSATIALNVNNPFGKEIKVTVVDKNVFGGNGIDIECMEVTIPANPSSTISYQPIQLFEKGKSKLSPAIVNYTNPDSDSVDSVESNELTVDVAEGSGSAGGQGITTIYQCNGMNMQSTSYSRSGQEQKEQQSMDEMTQQMQEQMQQQMSNVQNNQMPQDTGALKQEMQKQREEYKQMQQELAQKIQDNEEFKKAHEEMLEKGYNITSGEVDPESNSTGNFNMNYHNAAGETASISGNMQDGEMQELQKQSSAEDKQMMEQMQNNPEFQKMQNELAEQGFNQSQQVPRFDRDGNQTELTLEYQNAEGEKAEITAKFDNQTMTSVEMQRDVKKEEEEKDSGWYRKLPGILFMLAGIALVAYSIIKINKKRALQGKDTTGTSERPINYRKEAKKLLEEAKILFGDDRAKDAYERASQAVRLFYSHKYGYRKELTNSQTIDVLKKHNIGHKEVQKCLNMCGMVEFAKYSANKKDFSEIVKIAEEAIN
ncbi:MAG: hypothetical protein V1729_04795 [Candidatus Woesearchaeota archaeon]